MSTNPGNIEDFKKSSEDRVSLTLIKKDYTGKMLEGIKLDRSLIAKCIFNEAKIYNCDFKECEFTKDSFAKASLMGVDFSNCTFYSANFAGCKMSHVKFDENCKFIDSRFDNVEMNDNVVGLSIEDQKIITEGEDEFSKALKTAGFTDVGDGSLELNLGQYIKCSAYFDPDVKNWRITYFADNESVYTVDLYNKMKKDIIGKIKDDLEFVKEKLSDKEKYDDMEGEIAEITEFLNK